MRIRIGAHYLERNACEFIVWAPLVQEISLQLLFTNRNAIPMERDQWGYWRTIVDDVQPGARYLYLIDNKEAWSDPVSHLQPLGIPGCSAVVKHDEYSWIELMPVAEVPGNRNWGYDGVYPYSVHRGYGVPEGLKRLVAACRQHEIAVILDVVYIPLGPEGK